MLRNPELNQCVGASEPIIILVGNRTQSRQESSSEYLQEGRIIEDFAEVLGFVLKLHIIVLHQLSCTLPEVLQLFDRFVENAMGYIVCQEPVACTRPMDEPGG